MFKAWSFGNFELLMSRSTTNVWRERCKSTTFYCLFEVDRINTIWSYIILSIWNKFYGIHFPYIPKFQKFDIFDVRILKIWYFHPMKQIWKFTPIIFQDCANNTLGDHCEMCLPGYYGEPMTGQACKICGCPLKIESNK